MPKIFNAEEKEVIREKITKIGKDLFSRYGLQKTNIQAIVKECGIGKGTFYSFYKSKYELFFRILEIEGDLLQQQFIQDLGNLNTVTPAIFSYALYNSFLKVNDNPLLQTLLDNSEYEELVSRLHNTELNNHFEHDVQQFTPVITELQTQGLIKPIKIELIVNAIRGLSLISFRKKELGEELYKDTLYMMIKLVVDGIFVNKGDEI